MVLACAIAAVVPPISAQAQSTFMVRGVRLFDGMTVREGRSVLVQEGVIRAIDGADLAVPAGAEMIDGRGLVIPSAARNLQFPGGRR